MRKISLELILINVVFLFSVLFSFRFRLGDFWSVPLSIFSFIYIVFYGRKAFCRQNKMCWIIVGFILLAFTSSLNFFFFNWLQISYLEYILNATAHFWVFLVFYIFSVRNSDDTFFYRLGITYGLIAIVAFFRAVSRKSLGYIPSMDALNHYAMVFSCYPILYLRGGFLFQTSLIFLAILIGIASLKRTAIIFVIAIISMWFLFLILKNSLYLRTKLILISIFLVMLVAVLPWFQLSQLSQFSEVSTMVGRFERTSEDGGSGRVIIWDKAIKDISNFEFHEIIYGRGWAASRDDVEGKYMTLHNDCLEMFYSYGLCGLMLLILFYCRLFKILCFFWRNSNYLFFPYLIASTFLILEGLVSTPFSFSFSVMVFGFLGFIEGRLARLLGFKKMLLRIAS